jgi:hypothetical protein
MNALRALRVALALTLPLVALTPTVRAQLLAPAPADLAAPRDWATALVTLEVTYKLYDAGQPWNEPSRAIRKHGVVIAPGEILTTAQYLPTQTLVRAQKGGRGRWHDARVKWLDPHANLALITVDAPSFWQGLTPAPLAERVSRGPEFELVRWRDGNLERRRVEFSKYTVGTGVLGLAPHVQLEVGTDLSGLGWSELIVADGTIIGLTSYGSSRTCGALPAGFIRQILSAYRSSDYQGLGIIDFTWMAGTNPTLLDQLGLTGDPRGSVVIRPGPAPTSADPARAPQARDIVLTVDGRPVDEQGDYLDPDYGHLMMENLATRARFAGDTIPLTILRDGRELTLDYVPEELPPAPPPYLMAGGLIFQPLTQPFLRGWGSDWRKTAPFHLQNYLYRDAPDKRRSLVVLSGVLPDAINLGYENAALLVVDKVNGRPVATLADLAEALATPAPGAGVHRFDFMPGRGLQRLILDAATLEEATARIMRHYNLPAARRL